MGERAGRAVQLKSSPARTPPVQPEPVVGIPDSRALSEQLDAMARQEDAIVAGRDKLVSQGWRGWSVQDRDNNLRRAAIMRDAAGKLRDIGS